MKKKNKHFLITGGLGFIGSAIARKLLKNGFKISIFDNNSRGNISSIIDIKNKLKIINGDIKNYNQVNKSLKNIDAVIHLAYINGTKYFYSKPAEILDVAVKGMVNIIDGCIKNNIKELYLASSSEVYQTPDNIPTDEKASLKIPDIYNPRYSYGGGKILTELMGIHYGKKFFKKLIIFRPHNVYGPNMGFDHVIPEFISRFKKINNKNNKFVVKGSGNETRSFIFIDDFVNAFCLILNKGKHLNVYNIGTSEEIKIGNLAFKISKFFRKKITLYKTKIAAGSTKRRCPNILKIKKLGFKQKYNLNSGLRKTVNWYK